MTVRPSILGDKNSLIRTILSCKLFSFIARISFSTYLVHLFVVYQYIYSRSYDVYYDINGIFVIYLVIVLALGTALTLFVEVPFGNLLRLVMGTPVRVRV